MDQFQTWAVCQYCGAVTDRDNAPYWLIQPHRSDREIDIVRCPQHWSEWALRHTKEGRTKQNRQRMQEALQQPAPTIPAHLSPFPTTEKRR